MGGISAMVSRPAYEDLGPDQGLTPVFPAGTVPSHEAWRRCRAKLRARWDVVLGVPPDADFDRSAEAVRVFEFPECEAELFLIPTSPTSRQRALLLRPRDPPRRPCPGVIVPFYNPDLMLGYDLETGIPKDTPSVHFGRHLVQQGYIVVCGQAFPYNTVPEPEANVGFAWWQAAADELLRRHPDWTGMGRLVWDTRIALDFLLGQDDVDPECIAIVGHSLGGKIAFYTGCLDDRIRAIVASDFGMAFDATNWSADWYLGDKVGDPALGVAHHHLLALNAPRSFLILAGKYDGPVSWQYLNAARPVFELYGRAEAIGILDHATGHRPPPEAMVVAYRWLAEQLDLPEQSWALEPALTPTT